jgi:hypothetical protein
VSIPGEGERRTWVFDVTFLSSRWSCIYGRGCLGVLTGPAPELEQGCCSYGAHLTDEAEAARIEAAAATLTPQQWQFAARARAKSRPGPLRRTRKGALVTRIADGACIFLNRPGFSGGTGCALHLAALERQLPTADLKPDVCWQLPLRREDRVGEDGQVTSTVGEWKRPDWGPAGLEFHWWCTEGPEAFIGSRPVYETLRDELVRMVGPAVYERLSQYLGTRRGKAAPLPHPALRRTATVSTLGTIRAEQRLPAAALGFASVLRGLGHRLLVDLFLVQLLGLVEAPLSVIVLGIRATLWTRFRYHLDRALETPRFFEAPMSSLFHEPLLLGTEDPATPPQAGGRENEPQTLVSASPLSGSASLPHHTLPPRSEESLP